MRITLESTYSTAVGRRGSDDFILKLRDVCWDLPLTAPLMTKSGGIYTLILWHQANPGTRDIPKIDPSNKLSFTTGWPEAYCGGATYELEVVTADGATPKGQETLPGTSDPIDFSAAMNAILVNNHRTDGTDLNF